MVHGWLAQRADYLCLCVRAEHTGDAADAGHHTVLWGG